MTVRVGINGFGRIGRCVVRCLEDKKNLSDVQVVAINDLSAGSSMAHLYNYDSVHGKAVNRMEYQNNHLIINGRSVSVFSESAPEKIPWAAVDVVLECTGRFTTKESCQAHLRSGVRKVIVSAPGKGVDKTLVIGVNHKEYDPQKHTVVSNGSCTTNCLAPIVHVVHQAFGIVKGFMTTVHSYTNDQRILDVQHSDPRRARAAALNMIPTSTGAAKALGEVIPEMAGKLNGFAVRVPTSNVSLVDVTFELSKKVSVSEVNSAFQQASQGVLKNILGFCEEPLVSSDFNGNPLSCIIDAAQTMVVGDNLLKVLGWYDNEWGFSNRMVELSQIVA